MKCKHGFLHWIAEGDKRLICKKCKICFVLVNGKPIEIQKEKTE